MRAKRAVNWAWRLVLLLVLTLVVGGGAFCVWLLVTARHSGQAFSAVRDQALKAYSDSDR